MSPAEKAFRAELVAMLPRLRRFAATLSRSADLAEDVLQTALERALRSAHSYDHTRRLDSWMFKIIQNAWLDKRIELTRRQFVPLEDYADPKVDVREAVEARDELHRAGRAFARLPEEQRAVLALVVLEGFTYKEAAETLDVPIGTVMSRLARGRAAIVDAVRTEVSVGRVRENDHG